MACQRVEDRTKARRVFRILGSIERRRAAEAIVPRADRERRRDAVGGKLMAEPGRRRIGEEVRGQPVALRQRVQIRRDRAAEEWQRRVAVGRPEIPEHRVERLVFFEDHDDVRELFRIPARLAHDPSRVGELVQRCAGEVDRREVDAL